MSAPTTSQAETAPLARVAVSRYVTPLREGGSLPGIVEADDLGTYVCKFRGAGQGLRVLVAEVLVAELARRHDLIGADLVHKAIHLRQHREKRSAKEDSMSER